MPRFLSAGLLMLFFLLRLPAACAQGYEQGLFWEVVSPKGQRNILIGSVHLGDPTVQPQIDKALGLLKSANRLVLELDSSQMVKAARMMQSPSDTPFSQNFPPETARKLHQALAGKGLEAGVIEQMPAWQAVLALSVPDRVGAGMDLQLLKSAQFGRKPVLGLETAEEQIDVFRKLPNEILGHILNWLVDHQAGYQKELKAVLEAYRDENLAKLSELGFEKSVPATLSAQQQALVLDQLITRRNERMLQRMEPHLKSGKSVVAVGALHLPGILEGLDDLGYTVKRLEP